MKRGKRLFSLLLSVLLVVSLLPINVVAFAADRSESDSSSAEKLVEGTNKDNGMKFVYADSEKTVTATASDTSALPEGAVLVVNAIGESETEKAKRLTETQLQSQTELEEIKAYDVHFEVDGVEVEPSKGTVKVVFDFNEPILKEDNDGSSSELKVVHITDSEETESLDVNAQNTEDGALKTAEFEVGQFSTFCFAKLPSGTSETGAANSYTLAQIVSNMTAVAFGDLYFGNHNMGGFVVKGKFSGLGTCWEEGTIPSFVGGEYAYADKLCNRGTNGQPGTLYVGSQNTVSEDGRYVNGIEAFAEGHGTAIVNDNYVNWDQFKSGIESEMKTLSSGATMTLEAAYDWCDVEVPAGSNVNLVLNGIQHVNIVLTGNGTPTELINQRTIITVQDAGDINLPLLKGQYSDGEQNDGCGLIMICPNASNITIPDFGKCNGHILAPQANITKGNGNYNGCFIGKNISVDSEGHVRSFQANDDVVSKPMPQSPSTTVEVDHGAMEVTNEFAGDELTEEQKKEISYVVTSSDVSEGELDQKEEIKLENSKYSVPDDVSKLELTIPYEETDNGSFTLENLPVDTYSVEQVNTDVDGYESNTEITDNGKIEVKKNTVSKVKFKSFFSKLPVIPQEQTVSISKQDVDGNEIGGAHIVIKNEAGETVDEWTSVEGQSHDITVPAGTYTFHEEAAPNGYVAVTDITFTVDEDGNVTVTDANSNAAEYKDGKLVIVDQKEEVVPPPAEDKTVSISKQDVDGNEIGGAHIVIKNEAGETVDEWTSVEGESHEITVPAGTYTFHEEAAPNGYVAVTDITFTVDEDGNVTVTDANSNAAEYKDGKLVIVDQKEEVVPPPAEDKTVSISKQDVDGNEIGGAQIVIKNEAGETVDAWTSVEGQSHDITVPAGTYTFHEEAAPNGYVAVTDITFTVDEDGNVTVTDANSNAAEYKDGKLVIVDQKEEVVPPPAEDKTVSISKQDVDGNEIGGAHIVIKNEAGETVDAWTSVEGESHEITVPAGTYTFHEEAAPNGYVAVTDITFTVDEDGNVTVTDANSNAAEYKDGKLVIVDQKEEVVPPPAEDKKVSISKQDVDGNEIGGAHIVIKNEAGETVDAWTSVEGESHEITVPAGTYTFHEEAAPNGYVAVTDITFTVDEDGNVTVTDANSNAAEYKDGKLVIVDQKEEVVPPPAEDKKVSISKQDVDGNEIGGAHIVIKNEAGETVDAWTSVEGQSHEITVPAGTYTFHEEAAPNGYVAVTDITFTVDEDGNVTVTDANSNAAEYKDGKLVIVDQKEEVVPPPAEDKTVSISKQDVDGNEIGGAHIVIKNEAGETVDAWTSVEGQSHEITVPAGTYTFHEEAAPNGYVAVTDITFTVDEDGNVTVTDANSNAAEYKDGKLVIVDQKEEVVPPPAEDKTVSISKQDVDGNEIGGAHIVIKNEAGETVDEWTSVEGESHEITVPAGTYTFHEEAAPNGYVAVTDITFTVDEDGNVTVTDANSNAAEYKDGKLVIVDQKEEVVPPPAEDKTVSISKQDVDGNEIGGAHIVIKNEAGETVDAWTSVEGESHEITVPAGTYTFHEEAAPNGYVAVTDITFTVDEDGNVTVTDANSNAAEYKDGKLVIVDQKEEVVPPPAEDKTVSISKQDVDGNEIGGAHIVIKNEAGETVDAWTSVEGESHEITVPAGTYTFHEEAAPNGYVAVTDITFTVDEDGNVTVTDANSNAAEYKDGKLVIVDQKEEVVPPPAEDKKVSISKQDVDGNEIGGAHIVIKNEAGETVDAWTSVEGESHEITVPAGTYTFHEEAAPNGYVAVTDITFTVDEDGNVTVTDANSNAAEYKDGKLVIVDQKEEVVPPPAEDKKVSISKQDVDGNEIGGAHIVIKNEAGETVDAWTSVEGQSHEITVPAGTYTFHEEAAPNGYVAVTDITFTVDEDGNVTVTDANSNAAEYKDGKLVIVDQKEVVDDKDDADNKDDSDDKDDSDNKDDSEDKNDSENKNDNTNNNSNTNTNNNTNNHTSTNTTNTINKGQNKTTSRAPNTSDGSPLMASAAMLAAACAGLFVTLKKRKDF